MTPEHADAIAKWARHMDMDISARHDYSGRGMYGKTTSGVVGRIPAILAAAALAVRQMADDDAFAFVDALAKTSLDSMGRESIVY
jgi:hypothetical protein